jgi:hypothetical protein
MFLFFSVNSNFNIEELSIQKTTTVPQTSRLVPNLSQSALNFERNHQKTKITTTRLILASGLITVPVSR